MPETPPSHPVLRLTDASVAARPRRLRRRDEAARAVRSENRSASVLSTDDARWALAVSTATALEGGRSAVLSPERRRRLVSMGVRLGLRPFDSNLVIAIVQDGARTGVPLSRDVAERVALVRGREGNASRDAQVVTAIAISVVLGGLLLLVLVSWVQG